MERILGQDKAIEILRGALASERVHHAWIFSGPSGVGKFTTAVELARILLEPNPVTTLTGERTADPDGRTSHLIDVGTHPDLHVIRRELALYSENKQLRNRKLANIPLDILREHMIGGRTSDDRHHDAPAYRTAMLGHGKVFIVDEAERIDRAGQNALLKTLEEPPPRTYLVLVTSRPERLLPTIHSRCQHVRFQPLDAASMDAWFDRTGLDVDAATRAWIADFAEGRPGAAVRAVEYGFADWQRTLDPMLAELEAGRFPVEMGAALHDLVDGFAERWVKGRKNASKDVANKDGAQHVLSLLAVHARRRLAGAADTGADPTPWLGAIEVIRAAERRIEGNVNLKQALENLVVQWARVPRAGAPAVAHR